MVGIFTRKRTAQILVWRETFTPGKFTVASQGRLISMGYNPNSGRPLLTLCFMDANTNTHRAYLAFESYNYEAEGNKVRLKRLRVAQLQPEDQDDFSGYSLYEITFPD